MGLKEEIIKAELPKLDVDIGIFRHKKTKEMRFCVMSVSTGLTKWTHNYIYDAREWDKLNNMLLEGTERIQEAFHDDLYKKYGGDD